MAKGDGSESIIHSEHVSPTDTGDNISAKRSASYGWGIQAAWGRNPLPLVDLPYDSVAMSNADVNGNYQTIIFKDGGATVRTLALTYDVNSNVTSIARS